MSNYNVWLPGNTYYDFNDGVSTVVGYKATAIDGQVLCQTFSIPNAQAGFGITYDQINPAFNITKPPKLMYSSSSDMVFVLKDSDGWLWAAPCPKQVTVKERGWSWLQFALHSVQENLGTPPEAPASGPIQAFQFSGAEAVHGENNDIAQTISIAYLAGRPPATATAGSLRKVILTNRNSAAHTWKIGTIDVTNATRKPVRYIGALPFGLQLNGPRNRLSVLPYRGPIVAGYQGGSPWIHKNDMEKLDGMMDFMLEAQEQFRLRNPNEVFGPWMHIYLQALWDCEQNGEIDTWVWDGPDGNPAWDGWQYRAFDSMGRTWYEATRENAPVVPPALMTKIITVNTRFFDWLYNWMIANPEAAGVPNDWRPPGWTQGTPFPKDSYLDPKYTSPSAHDIGLALKGAIFCAASGYDLAKARYVIHRLVTSLVPLQVVAETDMKGAFTKNPDGFEVYGFEQGEVLEALALCLQHPEFLAPEPVE